ncbi:circadian clock-controlled protein daywake-like [Aricia agestis]|uniref:circadian clock-controlled protein daywake-like n=1 Tax=Aricia agestis TaxID=91739 RepID=UPI001C2038A8|nr:circadian clock-controlled protein daywake-like [Aricia agestis]
MKYLLFVFALSIAYISAHDANLPSYITPCDFKDPNLRGCIREEILKALPQFAKGLPELEVNSLDPFALNDIVINEPNLKITLSNPKLSGLSKLTLKEFQLDAKDIEADFVLNFVSDFHVAADYVADGKILILPIQGKGASTIDVQKMSCNITSKIKIHKDSEKFNHMKLSSPSYTYDIGSTVFRFENLFNGNKELSETTHKFANENWKQLMDDLAPPVIKQIATAIVKNINAFLSKIRIDKMVKNYPVHLLN